VAWRLGRIALFARSSGRFLAKILLVLLLKLLLEGIQPTMMKIRQAILIVPLLLATAVPPATAQRNDGFYNGVRTGGHGGQYNDNRHYYHDDHRRDQGGIGPGKGALIGAAGGAALGAIFGGGLKGTIVGGAAGAGVGAVVGQANQNSKRRDYYH
jgi:hypothetical protein